MVRPLVLLVAGVGLLIPGVARSPATWLLLTALTGWRVIADWPLADNHAYLLFYWCLALFCSLLTKDPNRTLALNGRLLIGLAFAFATLWKLFLSPDYLDGTFFRVAFLMDSRFEAVSAGIGGLSWEQLEENRRVLWAGISGIGAGDAGALVEPTHLRLLANAAAWWTVLLEGAIALCFLWPRHYGLSQIRHAALLLFCATTFLVAPVYGFGWLLLTMGLAQCGEEQRRLRASYLAVFVLLLLYREIPGRTLLGE